jgi:hypothetical protein
LDSRLQAAEHHHRQGADHTAVSTWQLHFGAHADCSQRHRTGVLVGAENAVTLCDLRIFVDQAAEPVPAQNAHAGYFGRRMRASGGRLLLK